MNPLTEEWILRADGDFIAAGRELRARKTPVYHVACFLSQQCAEKYLKAFLQQHQKDIPRIHKLIDLLKFCKDIDSSLEILRADLEVLERYPAAIRYPGITADKDDASAAYKAAKVVRQLMRQKLDLPPSL
jgi:HEPN domain-containing protein